LLSMGFGAENLEVTGFPRAGTALSGNTENDQNTSPET
jgi:hypothetical protein